MNLRLHSHSPLRIFAFSVVATILTFLGIGIYLGPGALVLAVILVAVELAFSFDNAIINAKVLGTMSPLWQKLFLTIGIVIAIFGMRVLFPIVIVMLTADLSWTTVVDLALHHPAEYADKLELAHPSISAFGGGFLLMLALHFFISDHRDILWIKSIERPLMRFSKWWVPAAISMVTLGIFAALPFNHAPKETIISGLIGIGLYLALNLFTEWAGKLAGNTGSKMQSGWMAFMTFMYLQVLDASFSFDGVIGAFAITNDVILIAAGLGVGAIWVRSLTVYIVRRGTLDSYKYLEHGAHYAVFALAATMLFSLVIHVPEILTGSLGLGLIGASILASRQALKAKRA